MDIKQVGIGVFEFDHVTKDGQKFWMRQEGISRYEAEELAEEYREIVDAEDASWAQQAGGAIGYLALLGSIGVIVWVISCL
jgi:hypothetical protein